MAVECFHTLKGYHLGIKDMYQGWFWDGNVWKKLARADYRSDWFMEDYEFGVATTGDVLANLCEYLPGVREWDDYGDFSVTFDMGDVEEVKWNEARLVSELKRMAHKVNRCRILFATDEPYHYTTKDAYGSDITYPRHPALKPLEGMVNKDYPADLDTTGDRRG